MSNERLRVSITENGNPLKDISDISDNNECFTLTNYFENF